MPRTHSPVPGQDQVLAPAVEPSEAAAGSAAKMGRRERNMLQKRSRILAAAAALFDERGFDGATTQEISDRADVATGTLFRYAPTKGQLLLMVFNAEFRRAIEQGCREVGSAASPLAQVCALIGPIVTAASRNAPNMAIYQRELLFGAPEHIHRAEGLSLVSNLEGHIAGILLASLQQGDAYQVAADRAARSVFAVLHLTLVQPATGAHPGSDPGTDLYEQIAQIVQGFLALSVAAPSAAEPLGAGTAQTIKNGRRQK
ncbi:TetR/AcrR family transcriptional regulator [Arthrobacter alpinus]|uniref:TetR/AcrR family transcriptional regulator n=1 Tax=Arthrobacter alpinus TaxID=656366 RepID=UPI000A7EE240|nr:TetR/AcrR family transcriptional regulator [Arthrobacter alpinus]